MTSVSFKVAGDPGVYVVASVEHTREGEVQISVGHAGVDMPPTMARKFAEIILMEAQSAESTPRKGLKREAARPKGSTRRAKARSPKAMRHNG